MRKLNREALSRPVDGSALATFRIGFGLIVTWEVWRAFDGNLIRADYDLPDFNFTWWAFSWVKPLPGVLLYLAFAALGVFAFLLAIGLFTRLAAIGTCVGLGYWILLEKAAYLNHRYLAALLALLFAVVPAGAAWSVDAFRRRTGSPDVPAWAIHLMRLQVGLPYFFAGVAKLNFDWLVRAEPLRSGLAANTDVPLVGRYLASEGLALVLAWGSAALDILVPFLMLYRRTRVFAFAFAIAFHLINSRLFDIGMFPWMMIIGTTVFFEPDWPRRALKSFRSGGVARTVIVAGLALGFLLGGFVPDTFALVRAACGAFGVAVLLFHALPERSRSAVPSAAGVTVPMGRRVAAFLVVWTAIQLLLPLRHFVIPGNVHWTEEGNRFAWQMLLRVTTARVEFVVTDPGGGETWTEDLTRHFTAYQIRKARLPDLILEAAHHIESVYRDQGLDDVEVRVNAFASLNGRKPQRLIRKNVDLTQVFRPYVPPARWILPLKPYEEWVRSPAPSAPVDVDGS